MYTLHSMIWVCINDSPWWCNTLANDWLMYTCVVLGMLGYDVAVSVQTLFHNALWPIMYCGPLCIVAHHALWPIMHYGLSVFSNFTTLMYNIVAQFCNLEWELRMGIFIVSRLSDHWFLQLHNKMSFFFRIIHGSPYSLFLFSMFYFG